jgi:predicted RNA-binding protein YlxR (DUF448 family)
MSDDAGLPAETGPERTCIVTRRTGDPDTMLRFVVGPDNKVVFDLRRRLPGRGAWVSAEAAVLETAVKRKAFGRAFKRPVEVDAALVEQVDSLMERDTLQSLALANKAGRVVCGSTKVQGALAEGQVVALLRARGASPDGARKIEAGARRSVGGEKPPPPVVQMFESHQMDLALGRSNVIHAALLIGGASDAFLERAARLSRFRGSDPQGAGRSVGGSLPDGSEAAADGHGASIDG